MPSAPKPRRSADRSLSDVETQKPQHSHRELLSIEDDDDEDLTATWMARGIDPTHAEFSGGTMTPAGWSATHTEKSMPPEEASLGAPDCRDQRHRRRLPGRRFENGDSQ